MAFEGVKFIKVGGGLGRRNPSLDKEFALVMGGVTTDQYQELGTIVQLIEPAGADELGFTAGYDSTNKVLVNYNITEHFRDNPDSTLYVMIVPQGTSQTQMWDKENDYVHAMLMHEKTRGKVRVVGTVLNPAAEYDPNTTGGIDADVLTAIPKAQELIDELSSQNIYVDAAIIEGRNLVSDLTEMPDFRALTARNASVVVAADPLIVGMDEEYKGSAAVGAVLMGLGVRNVGENLGSVDIITKPRNKRGNEAFPLNDPASGRWESAALSNGMLWSELSAAQKALLESRGAIYVGKYEGYPGFYFSDSPTCIEAADDYAQIENNRVWNKAVRYLIEALTPRLKGKFKKDPDTGFPLASTIASWETAAITKLEQMERDDEISGIDLYINPEQQISKSNPLVVKLGIIVDGILYGMDVEVGLQNQVSN